MAPKMGRPEGWFEEELARICEAVLLSNPPFSVGSTDSDGDTPLHVFAGRGDAEGVEECLRRDADVNAVGDMGESPLHAALGRGGNLKVVELLLRGGARTDILDEFGRTPAAMAMSEDLVMNPKHASEEVRRLFQTMTDGGFSRRHGK